MSDHTQDNQQQHYQNANSQQQQAREPVDRVNESGNSAAIWENEGKHGKFYNVTLSRSFKDKDGNYGRTDSFRKQDLPILMEVIRDAYGSIREFEKLNRQERQQNNSHDQNADRNSRRETFKAERSNGQQQGQNRGH